MQSIKEKRIESIFLSTLSQLTNFAKMSKLDQRVKIGSTCQNWVKNVHIFQKQPYVFVDTYSMVPKNLIIFRIYLKEL